MAKAARDGGARRIGGAAAPAAAAAALLALAGCAADPGGSAAHYAAVAERYLAAGRMRTDPAPPDAPFGKAELVRNFERIAFNSEFARADALEARRTPTAIFKWEGPVRWRVIGDGATEADRDEHRALSARLAGPTGLDLAEAAAGEPADVVVMIAGPALRARFAAMIRRRGASGRMSLIEEWTRNDLYPCVGQVGLSEGPDGARERRAFIVIKAEIRGLLRRSCIHEEFVQSLGLLNDDAAVRPSIFNDDQEFALLTRHDEWLLRILYDPRLEAGVRADEGMPVVRRIVAEIGPDGPAGDAAPPPVPRAADGGT